MSSIMDNGGKQRVCKCHGRMMWRNGTRNGRQEWACQVQRRALNAQRFRTSIGGDSYYHGHFKDPAALMRLQMRVLEHRTKQAEDYRAFSELLD
jgi:hypothetical protein